MASPKERVDTIAYAPFGLREPDAARYVGLSATAFRERVKAGTLPKARRDRGVVVWLRAELEAALQCWPAEGEDAREDLWAARIGS